MSRDVPDVTVVSKHSFSDRKIPPDYPADCPPDCPRLNFPVNEMPSKCHGLGKDSEVTFA